MGQSYNPHTAQTLHLGPVTALISLLICVGVWCGGGVWLLLKPLFTHNHDCYLLFSAQLVAAELVSAQWAIVQVLTHDSCQGSVKLVTVLRMV